MGNKIIGFSIEEEEEADKAKRREYMQNQSKQQRIFHAEHTRLSKKCTI
jgi:hypothetical protein